MPYAGTYNFTRQATQARNCFDDGDMVVLDGDRQVTDGVCCVIYQTDGERLARLKLLRRTKRTVTRSSAPRTEKGSR